MHPTKKLLLDTAVELIDEFGPQGFTVDALLERSSISKGSLYHHFHDFGDVVDQAQLKRFSRYGDQDIEFMTGILSDCSSRDELLRRFDTLVESTHSPDRVKIRADRAVIVGSSFGSDAFRKNLGKEEQRLTDATADLVREMQERGIIRKEHSPATIAMYIQAVFIGRILNDVAEEPVEDADWGRVVRVALESLL